MKNNVLYLIKSKLNIKVKGHNIERFIKRLKNNNIEILDIKYISNDEINIKIYKYDYDKIIKIKTIYEIEIIDYYGIIRTKNNLLNNRYIIMFILISLVSLYLVTSLIFEIDVVTNDSKMEKNLLEELEQLGIKKYKFKKNYIRLQEIKNKLLNNHKDELEWLEIDSIGTKYIIRYESRIKNDIKDKTPLRNIIAKKDCVIRDMNISSGQIIKEVDSYVKKGDVIVSGYITLNENIKDTVSSIGTIYGETWYKVTITYPYKYKEVKETGNSKEVLVIKFLGKDIELFNFNKYNSKNIKEKTILKNNLLPIKFVKQKQLETIIIDENNTDEELINKAVNLAKNKMEENLDESEYVKDYKILNKTKHSDSITLNIFFNVVEDVTEYQEIEEYKEELEEDKEN
ncbi:MAG: sporulation protein YqfD [Bacilli bacterium]|nr:sporulation protein YqfD [Bacilli bacterium]